MTGRIVDTSIPCPRCGRTGLRYRRRLLCFTCAQASVADGTLADYPPLIRRSADVIDDYRALVLRDPSMPNREIARRIGMKPKALTRALARARAAGRLDLRRVAHHCTPEIARHGERNGVPTR